MNRLCIPLLLLCLIAQGVCSTFESRIVVMKSVDAPGKVTVERIATCLRLMALELKLSDKDLPLIVVLHVSRKGAAAAGMDRTKVRRSFDANTGQTLYYELWIVGEPRIADYCAAVMRILENHLGQAIDDKQRITIMQRAVRYLENTVSATG